MALRASRAKARVLQHNLDGEPPDDVTPRRKRFNEEERHQILLFDKVRELRDTYPDLRYCFSTMNGVYIPPALLKRVIQAGLIRGVFDIFLPVSRADRDGMHYCGAVIEMKKLKGGRPSPEQMDWAAHLAAHGWRVYFCAGAVDAWRCIASYLGIAGADHWAPDLQQQEEYVRVIS